MVPSGLPMLLALCVLLSLSFSSSSFTFRPPLLASTRRTVSTLVATESDPELEVYWKSHGDKWAVPLRLLDVRAAWACGELDGILPSGKASRVETGARMLTLSNAVELFESGGLAVRRRFRGMTAEELAPRWSRVVQTRASLKASGRWDDVIVESEKVRSFEKSLVEGSVEDEDASPLASRVVATVLSPALRAAAKQRDRADGGIKLGLATLMASAGEDAAERWLTAALLAELENEADSLKPAKPAAPSSTFAATEAQRDVEQAQGMGVYGLLAGLTVVLLQALLLGAGGEQSSLESTLDLMK